MLKIKTKLTDSAGGDVVSGTIIDFGTDFPPKRAMIINFRMFAYKSMEYFDGKSSPYVPKEIVDFSPIYKMTEQDFKDLTPLKVHEELAVLIAEQSKGAISIDDIEIIF